MQERKSSDQICEELGFTNPKIEYTDEQCQELKTYKEYSAFIRPIIQEANPKMAMSKVP